jgi:membrane protease YdiL (CAAX protease family)
MSLLPLFRNRHGVVRSGWALAAATAVMFAAELIARPLSERGDADDPLFVVAVTLVFAVAIAGTLALFKVLYRAPFVELGLVRRRWWLSLCHGLVLGAVTMSLVFAVLLATGQAGVQSVNARRLLSPATAAGFVSVAVIMGAEELLARGFFMTALKKARHHRAVVVVVPAALFALLHLMNGGATVLGLVNTFLAGLLLACLFVRSGSLWLPAGFHIAWNFLEGDVFGMPLSGTDGGQTPVFATELGTNAWLTGGDWGPEGGLLTTGALALAAVYTHVALRRPVPPGHGWTLDGGAHTSVRQALPVQRALV